MVIDDIIRITKRLCDDDQSIATSDLQDWINLGINQINQALKVNIPSISGSPTNSTSPGFDARYHEVLVHYCVSKYREGDSDYNAAGYFMKLFNDRLDIMQRDMPKNPSIRMDDNVQQIIPTSTGQSIYTLNIPYGAYFGDITVYQNDNDITDNCTFDLRNKQMVIDTASVTIATTDKITIVYDMDTALNNAPYQFWENSGW